MNGPRTLIVLLAAAPVFAQPAPSSRRAAVDAAPAVPVQPVSPSRAARGTSLAVVIEQVLDSKADFDAQNQNIVVVLAELTKRTGLRLVIDEEALDRLPYGEQTKVSVKIKDAPLREAIRGLLSPIGLAFEVREHEVGVVATAPLRRVLRRATWEELDLLRTLGQQPWSEQLWTTLNVQFQDSSVEEKMDKPTLGATAAKVGSGSALDVLSIACNQLGWTWYPSGDRVVVLSKRRQLERQLGKKISAKFFRVPINDVLLDLSKEAGGLLVKLDPGALASLPPQIAQTFTLTVENTSIRQAFEVISGTTGLGFTLEQDGVRFSASQVRSESLGSGEGSPSAAVSTVAKSSTVVGMVTIKGENGAPDISLFVRETDLPPDLRELHRKKIEDAVKALRKVLGGVKDTGVEQ